MAFKTMRDKLIKDGYLDKKGKLTQKGHNYVEIIKKDLRKKLKPIEWEEEHADH